MEKMPRTGNCTLVGFGRDKGFLGRNKAFWFCVATVGFVSRQDLVLVRGSRPCLLSIVTMSRQRFPYCDRDGHKKRSCCDRFGLGWEFLGRERTFLVATENRQD